MQNNIETEIMTEIIEAAFTTDLMLNADGCITAMAEIEGYTVKMCAGLIECGTLFKPNAMAVFVKISQSGRIVDYDHDQIDAEGNVMKAVSRAAEMAAEMLEL